jgi:hypothetical protein
VPERLEFTLDGGFTAVYRDGACKHGGAWGVAMERDRVKLVTRWDENECDLRGKSSGGATEDYIHFLDDLLLLRDLYAPADKKPDASVFVFDRYGNSVRTRGEFRGPLTKGKPIRLELTHASASGSTYVLKSVEIGFQKYKLFPGGFTAEGEIEWVLNKDLAGRSAAHDAPYKHTVEFTPPLAGEHVGFSVRLKYQDIYQPYDGHATFIARVAEE